MQAECPICHLQEQVKAGSEELRPGSFSAWEGYGADLECNHTAHAGQSGNLHQPAGV